MQTKQPDEEVIKRVLAGDVDAFNELVRKYQGAVYGLAYHFVRDFSNAEDLAQEAFIQAYLKLDKLDEPAKFAAWLKGITANICRMFLRSERRNVVSIEDLDVDAHATPHTEEPSERLERQELRDAIMDAIHALPENSRLVVTLYYIDGLSQREIGEFLSLPTSTVKSRLHDARRRLRKEMMEMAQKTLREQKPDLTTDMTKKMSSDVTECFDKIIGRANAADRGHLYLFKTTVTQTGSPKWVKVTTEDIKPPWDFRDCHFGLTNRKYWRLATEADNAAIRNEKSEGERWVSNKHIYVRKESDAGAVSDTTDVYVYNITEAGAPVDENGRARVAFVRQTFESDFFDKLSEQGFKKIGEKQVKRLRMGGYWYELEYFREVTQHHFKKGDGLDVYFEVGIPTNDEMYLEFFPEKLPGGTPVSGIMNFLNSCYKLLVCCPAVETSAPTVIWGHWGQVFSIYAPLDFSMEGIYFEPPELLELFRGYGESEFGIRREPGLLQWKSLLIRAQAVKAFFDVVADYLRYPEAGTPRQRIDYDKMSAREQYEEKFRQYEESVRKMIGQYGSVQEMYKQKAEELKNVGSELLGVCVKFYEAKADSSPTSPPDGMRIEDVKIDLSGIGFQLVSGEKRETAYFGDISVDMPENSFHLSYRGQRGKKVEIDLVKFNSHIEAREFFGKTQPKRVAYSFGEFFTPFVLFRSPHFVEVYKHVNAIWIEGSWLINLRIPITKPSKAKSKRELLPEEKLREQVTITMLSQFAKMS